jgi:hypothetical protein
MDNAFMQFGRVLMICGLLVTFSAQLVAVVRIFRTSTIGAFLALVLPGYVLYYVWRSEYKMPRVFRAWMLGFVTFIIGLVVVGIVV